MSERKRRAGSGGRTANRPSRAAGEARAPKPVPVSDPHEFTFLPLRAGRTWAPVEVDAATRHLTDLMADGDSDAGRRAWRLGDKLTELYAGFPERVKGLGSFTAFATTTFGLKQQEVSEFLLARRRVKNAETAGALGRTRIQLAFRLMDRLDVKTLETLEERDLPLPDGTTCRFPATVAQLRDALAVIPAGTQRTPLPRRLTGKAARCNAAFREARSHDPDLSGVRASFKAEDGDVVLRTGKLNTRQRVPLARLVLQLDADE